MAEIREDIDKAILDYLESENIEVLKPFVGKVNGYEPYNEPELGKAIDTGNIELIKETIEKLTTFDETEQPKDECDQELDYLKERSDTKKRTDKLKDMYNRMETVAKANKKSGIAKQDLNRIQMNKEILGKAKTNPNDTDYINKQTETLKKFKEDYREDNPNDNTTTVVNSSEVNKMAKLTKKDMRKLTSALGTLSRHFAEESEDYEDETENVPNNDEDEATDEVPAEEESHVYEMPQSLVDQIEEIINNPVDGSDLPAPPEAEEDEEEVAAEDEDDEEEQYAACGTSEFSEDAFYEFSEAITETMQNLNRSVKKLEKRLFSDDTPLSDEQDDLSKEAQSKSEKGPEDQFIEEFSTKDFRQFAESITQTLENINQRIDQFEGIKVNGDTPDKVTTDLTNIEQTGDDYEEMFITEAEEAADKNQDGIVENPEASVAVNAETTANVEKFSKRYEKVKNFLSFSERDM